jgi:hypothetical protein
MLAQRTQQIGRNGFDGRLQHGSSATHCRSRFAAAAGSCAMSIKQHKAAPSAI